jgi:hypothetical protein
VDDFNRTIVREVLSTMWLSKSDSAYVHTQLAALMAAMAAFGPTDEIEATLAAQAVALDLGAMECFRRAMDKEQPSDVASRLRKDGANLARGMTDMLEALDRKRGMGPGGSRRTRRCPRRWSGDRWQRGAWRWQGGGVAMLRSEGEPFGRPLRCPDAGRDVLSPVVHAERALSASLWMQH